MTESTLKQFAIQPISFIGNKVIHGVHVLGTGVIYFGTVLRQLFSPPYRWSLILQQLEFIGNQSLNIVLLSAFFTGAVFGLQIGSIFKIFSAEGIMGAATAKALARELAPMMASFILAGRAGSAMTAEISTMKVNEQIDAMEAMGVNPISYLVVPRVIAAILMLPLLTGIYNFLGLIGSFIMGVWLFDVDQGVFLAKITKFVKFSDLVSGLEKSIVFGVIIAAVACRFGLQASGGARGVGTATTNSVVFTLMTLLVFDFCITYIQIMVLK